MPKTLKREMANYLGAFVKLRKLTGRAKPNGLKYEGFEDFVLKTGTFKRATKPLPEGVEIGEKKMCFENAYRLAMKKDWTYVEGWAESVIPLHHAWCLDDKGRVVDPTWEFEKGRAYWGVEFDMAWVGHVLLESKTWGVFYKPETFKLLEGERDD
jgi:hypothetical protein